MHFLALVGLAGCGFIAHTLLILYRHIASPLRSIPGPFIARFTDLWYLYHLRQGRFEVVNQQLHERYGISKPSQPSTSLAVELTSLLGPVVRYGPNRYSFATLDAGKAIYGHGTSFTKSSWYNAWKHPAQWSLFADRDIKRHAANRRLFQNTYSMSSLVSYEPYVDECADLFSQRLTEMAQGGVEVDMGHWLQCYAFDVIGSITYSKRLGFLDQGLDIGGVIHALEGFLGYATLTGVYASIHPYLFGVKNWLAGEKGVGRAYVQNFTKECMVEHQANPKSLSADGDDEDESNDGKAKDFLTKFFGRHIRDPDSFTTIHIAAGCSQNMVAGSDTTAISLSAILYYLLKNPSCMQKIREEITKLQAGGTSSEESITFKESQDMPYLQAIIREALRIHPATGLPLERVVPEGGATISGKFFPEGASVPRSISSHPCAH